MLTDSEQTLRKYMFFSDALSIAASQLLEARIKRRIVFQIRSNDDGVKVVGLKNFAEAALKEIWPLESFKIWGLQEETKAASGETIALIVGDAVDVYKYCSKNLDSFFLETYVAGIIQRVKNKIKSKKEIFAFSSSELINELAIKNGASRLSPSPAAIHSANGFFLSVVDDPWYAWKTLHGECQESDYWVAVPPIPFVNDYLEKAESHLMNGFYCDPSARADAIALRTRTSLPIAFVPTSLAEIAEAEDGNEIINYWTAYFLGDKFFENAIANYLGMQATVVSFYHSSRLVQCKTSRDSYNPNQNLRLLYSNDGEQS